MPGGSRLPPLWTDEGRCGTPRGACARYFSRPRLAGHGHIWATSRRPAPGDFRPTTPALPPSAHLHREPCGLTPDRRSGDRSLNPCADQRPYGLRAPPALGRPRTSPGSSRRVPARSSSQWRRPPPPRGSLRRASPDADCTPRYGRSGPPPHGLQRARYGVPERRFNPHTQNLMLHVRVIFIRMKRR